MAYSILLVEDDASSRDIVARLLVLDGYEVDTAQHGSAALGLLARRSYDVILSDLRMPQVTGEALYRRIERGWPHLAPRVVFITTERPTRRFQAQYDDGRILTKPFTGGQLRNVIASVIARAA